MTITNMNVNKIGQGVHSIFSELRIFAKSSHVDSLFLFIVWLVSNEHMVNQLLCFLLCCPNMY